jgi:hypothetical protein
VRRILLLEVVVVQQFPGLLVFCGVAILDVAQRLIQQLARELPADRPLPASADERIGRLVETVVGLAAEQCFDGFEYSLDANLEELWR